MDNNQYNILIKIAIFLTVAWIGWSIYDGAFKERFSGESHYHAANKYFEDGLYEEALMSYQKAISEKSNFVHAKRGVARTLMQLGRNKEALSTFNEVITQEPKFAASYANRGILHDRMQNYTAAITDYKKAIQLDSQITKGPSWITRFLRNQAEKPPTILDRLNYLQSELQKPEEERTLQLLEKDSEQRPYKL